MFLYSIVISTIYIDIDIVKNISLLYHSICFASLDIGLLRLTLSLPVSALYFDLLFSLLYLLIYIILFHFA